MLQWDFVFSLGYLPLHHKQYKQQKNIYILIYTFQYHSALLLNFGFTGFCLFLLLLINCSTFSLFTIICIFLLFTALLNPFAVHLFNSTNFVYLCQASYFLFLCAYKMNTTNLYSIQVLIWAISILHFLGWQFE